MAEWIIYSFLALLVWGLYGFFPKLSVKYISPPSALVWYAGVDFIVSLIGFALLNMKLEYAPRGVFYAGLTGVCAALGTLFYLLAVSKGKLSVVVTVTSLYPLVTIFLALFFLKEPLTARQMIGIALAVSSIVVLTG